MRVKFLKDKECHVGNAEITSFKKGDVAEIIDRTAELLIANEEAEKTNAKVTVGEEDADK